MPLPKGSDEENGRGFLRGPLLLKAKSSENLSNFELLGALEQGRKPGGKFGGTMTDCFRVQTSYSENLPC